MTHAEKVQGRARQLEANGETGPDEAGGSSQPIHSPPKEDEALPDSQPHADGCDLPSDSGRLPPTVPPASSTHIAASGSSEAAEVRKGACGCGQ